MFNVWFSVSGTVWEGLEDVALLERVWTCWRKSVTGDMLFKVSGWSPGPSLLSASWLHELKKLIYHALLLLRCSTQDHMAKQQELNPLKL